MGYEATVWQNGDLITAEKLNNIENGIENNTIPTISLYTETDKKYFKKEEIENVFLDGNANIFKFFDIQNKSEYLFFKAGQGTSNGQEAIFYRTVSNFTTSSITVDNQNITIYNPIFEVFQLIIENNSIVSMILSAFPRSVSLDRFTLSGDYYVCGASSDGGGSMSMA